MMTTVARPRRVLWTGTDGPRAEVCDIEFGSDGLEATGIQIGLDPQPYRLDYSLDTGEGFVTRNLDLELTGSRAARLRLAHDGNGSWQCSSGPTDTDALDGALDCDLGLSPLTNLMPIRRHRLHEQPGSAEIVVAWVSVPDLSVHASRQRYEHVRRTDHGAIVRFVDLGLHEGFTAELEVDEDGLIVTYPELAERVG